MFHQRLGSFFDKVKRITSLAKFIAVWVPNASITKVEGVAQICKADLATSVVKEFPEMAGFVGYHYLKIAGEEDQDILSGVMSHNMPVNAHDQCPTNPIAIAVSLADKLDSLVGFFSQKHPLVKTTDEKLIRVLSDSSASANERTKYATIHKPLVPNRQRLDRSESKDSDPHTISKSNYGSIQSVSDSQQHCLQTKYNDKTTSKKLTADHHLQLNELKFSTKKQKEILQQFEQECGGSSPKSEKFFDKIKDIWPL